MTSLAVRRRVLAGRLLLATVSAPPRVAPGDSSTEVTIPGGITGPLPAIVPTDTRIRGGRRQRVWHNGAPRRGTVSDRRVPRAEPRWRAAVEGSVLRSTVSPGEVVRSAAGGPIIGEGLGARALPADSLVLFSRRRHAFPGRSYPARRTLYARSRRAGGHSTRRARTCAALARRGTCLPLGDGRAANVFRCSGEDNTAVAAVPFGISARDSRRHDLSRAGQRRVGRR